MYEKFWKRFFDFSLSLFALIVLSPLFLILSVTGAAVMKGNPFFCQKRPGKIDPATGKERIFSLVKFRTMTNEKDENGELLPDEKRLVPYGTFLRKTSLDELPELFNILVGHMSIIGPRPLIPRYLPYFTPEERQRHSVRPGLTGYAQAHGRNNVTWEERFALDLWYIGHISLKTDLAILFCTVKVVLKHDDIELNALEDFDEYRKHTSAEAGSDRD